MWLFFTHSFDVGDVVNYEGDRYEVVKIKLQYVVMKRVDGAHVIIPTNAMSSARIHNVSRCVPPPSRAVRHSAPPRSKAQSETARKVCRSDLAWEGIVFSVDVNTAPPQLERAATEIVANIRLNPKWYGGDYRIFLTDSAPGFKLELSVFYNHAGCGVDPCPPLPPPQTQACLRLCCLMSVGTAIGALRAVQAWTFSRWGWRGRTWRARCRVGCRPPASRTRCRARKTVRGTARGRCNACRRSRRRRTARRAGAVGAQVSTRRRRALRRQVYCCSLERALTGLHSEDWETCKSMWDVWGRSACGAHAQRRVDATHFSVLGMAASACKCVPVQPLAEQHPTCAALADRDFPGASAGASFAGFLSSCDPV